LWVWIGRFSGRERAQGANANSETIRKGDPHA
jgi:hypothetical protein